MDRNEREENGPSSIQSCMMNLEKARRTMHESAKDVVELVNRANYLLERARCSNEQQEERLEEGMEELSLCLPGLDQGLAVQPTLSPRNKELQKPSRRGEYWTFAIFNPLQYITTNNVPWESPVVSLGGDQGYRACLQMYVSNKESWQGGTLGVGLRLKPGPYDAWLPWPFPGKGVKVAMFRINGKQPYVISFSIPKLGRYGIREAKCSHFLSIQNFMDDTDLVDKKPRPNGEDDVLLIGFAVQGEETFFPTSESILEQRVKQLEQSMQKVEPIADDLYNSNRRLAQQISRSGRYRHGDHYCC